jgi:NAD(P)-dependent dehydrogenase (short-subunit alcohol dehydrogenase family)
MRTDAKVVVITGASSGIGAALALRLAAGGHRLALAARRLPELERVARDAEAGGSPRALVVEADVTRRADVEKVRDAVFGAFGGFDVWVNNAGRGIVRATLDLSDADFDEMMAVNVKSALYGMQVAVPHFIARDAGHVINVTSYLGRVPIATIRSAYNAAKAALNSLTANARVDLRATHPNIHVSVVMPGIVKTEFARHAVGAAPGATIPRVSAPGGAPPPQTVEEVADAIANLIAHPVPEIYTHPGHAELTRRYYADVAAFEAASAAATGPAS